MKNTILRYCKLFLYGVFAVLAGFGNFFGRVGNFGEGGRSDYNIGKTEPTIRQESYRKIKRRNRLMRKFDHGKDEDR